MYTMKDFISFKTIVHAEVSRFMRVWVQTLMPPAITMTLYFVVFGHFIGSQLTSIHGFSFIQYMMPGLVIMSIIMQSFNNAVFSFFIYRFHKAVDEILITPTPYSIIMLGFVVASALRGLITGCVVLIISMFFTHISPHSVALVLLSAILSAVSFAMIGFTNAIFAKKFDDVSIFPTFILTPLIYLGGVFYSIAQLPELWKTVSMFNPVMYIVATFRYAFLGVADVNIVFSFGMLVLFIAIMFVINMRLLHKGVGIKT